MTQVKRVLILYADAGFGHRSAAKSVKTALEEKYGADCQVEMVNPLEDKRAPFYLRDVQTDYDSIIRYVPELYRIGYEASDGILPAIVLESVLIPMLYDVMNDLIKRHKPDVIVTSYPIYQAPLDAVFTMKQINIPLVTVVTDLVGVHHMWFNVGAESWMVSTEMVQQQAVKAGVPTEKVIISGIPVSTEFSKVHPSKAEVRANLGLDPDRFTLLVAGSKRVEGLPAILEGLNHSGHPLELVLVAGGDEALYQALRGEDWHLPVRIHNYVDFIPALLVASDAVICKAGGLIVSEALAAGLPMLLVNVLPGQERGNAEYVIANSAGEMTETSQQLLEITAHWLQNDRQLWAQCRDCAQALGKPDAAFTIADEVMRLAREEVLPRTVKHLFKRSHLVNVLKRYRQEIKHRFADLSR